MNKRTTGTHYEQVAGRYLETLGYKILEYNFRCRSGEIDIIARDGRYLVFCEVKYRKDLSKGLPAAAVGFAKQLKISRCALYYLMIHHCYGTPSRFDVVGILGKVDNLKITLIRDAFPFAGEDSL